MADKTVTFNDDNWQLVPRGTPLPYRMRLALASRLSRDIPGVSIDAKASRPTQASPSIGSCRAAT